MIVFRRMPIPISVVVVMTALIALFIFFGAWAVSVDAADREQRLSSVIVNGGLSFGVNPAISSLDTGQTRLASDVTDTGSTADTWWGHTLLVACLLH